MADTQLDLFGGLARNPACSLCRRCKDTERVCDLPRVRQSDLMVVTALPSGRHSPMLKGLMDLNPYWTSSVLCDGKDPTKGEVKSCSKWLASQIQAVKPKVVLLVGSEPLMSITGAPGIKKARGRPFEKDGIVYLPTYSPGYAQYEDFAKHQFNRDIQLLHDILEEGRIPRERDLNATLVATWDDVDKMLKDLKGCVSFDIETNCLYPWRKLNDKGELDPARITMFGFGTRRAQYSVPADIPGSPWTRQDLARIVEMIDDRLQDCTLVGHNGKFDLLWMWVHYGVQWQTLYDFDTQFAHYLLDENDLHGLKYLAQKYCGAPDWDVDSTTKTGGGSLQQLALYHAHDLYYTRKLRYVLGRLLSKDGDVKQVFHHLMMPVAKLFVEVEYDGICVDVERHQEAEQYLRDRYNSALRKLEVWSAEYLAHPHNHAVPTFNWGSSKQLAHLLYGKKREGGLGLECKEKTKKGAQSCGESAVKQLDHPCVEDLLIFREAKQQLAFFIEGWKPFFHTTSTGVFIHPSFKLHGTVTGRPSCENPNLQQVPRDKRIRSLLTAPKGWTLVDADLSQIELRIAAELAKERELTRVFLNGEDPHWITAIREIGRAGGKAREVISTAHAFLKRSNPQAKAPSYAEAIEVLLRMGADTAIEIDEGWKELRKKAKAINFGYLYGMWWKKFKIYARDNYGVKVTDEEAMASRDFYFQLYGDFPAWHTRQKKYARMNGYVRTLTGRKRRLPDAMLPGDSPARGAAERQAINSPVQGFAAELNLMVALQLREEFTRSVVRVVGTVHDAILMWVRNGHEERVLERLKQITARPQLFDTFGINLRIPIEGDAVLGPWGAGVKLGKWKEAQCKKNAPATASKAPARGSAGSTSLSSSPP